MTTIDERAFLRAIAAEPENDTPRLAFADWLDEREPERVTCPQCEGDLRIEQHHDPASDTWRGGRKCPTCRGVGTVLDTRARDRAEFIRGQIELARLMPGGYLVDESDETHYTARCLKTRTDTLLAAHQSDWLHMPCTICGGDLRIGQHHDPASDTWSDGRRCLRCNGSGDMSGLTWEASYDPNPPIVPADTRKPPIVHWSRGFPHAVECRLSDAIASHFHSDTYRATDWARAVCTHHPVSEFRVSDRAPDLSGHPQRYFGWQKTVFDRFWSDRDGEQSYRYSVPDVVFEAIDERETTDSRVKYFDTREAALTALARALATLVRSAIANSQKVH